MVQEAVVEIREQLRRLTEKIDGIAERFDRLDRPLPRVLSRERAAQELSISVSQLKVMLRRGEIRESQPRGGRRGIPASEVFRLAAPTQPKTSTRRKPAPKSRPKDAREQAAEFRAQLRRRS